MEIIRAENVFTQTGVGAVTRKVGDKALERFSVRDFGAVGDGVVDDTTAFANCFAAAAGASFVAGDRNGVEIYITDGNYKITASLTLPRSAWITGPTRRSVLTPPNAYGAALLADFAGPVFIASPGSSTAYDLLISNLQITGDKATHGAGNGITLNNVTDVEIENIVISQFGTYNISTAGDNVHLRNVYSAQAGTANYFINSANSTVMHCAGDTATGTTNFIAGTSADWLFVGDHCHFECHDNAATGMNIQSRAASIIGNFVNMTASGGTGVIINTTTARPKLIFQANMVIGSSANTGIGLDIQSGIDQTFNDNIVAGFATACKLRGDGAILSGNNFQALTSGLDVTATPTIPFIVTGNFIAGVTNSLLHNSGNKAIYTGNRFDDTAGTYKAPTISAGAPIIQFYTGTAIEFGSGVFKYTFDMGLNRFTHPQSMATVWHNAAQSIANATYTVLAFNQDEINTDGMHSTVTNNSRLIAPVAGKYRITGSVMFAANAVGMRAYQVRLNAAGNPAAGTLVDAAQCPPGGDDTILSKSKLYTLAANDYVELFAYQSSTGALNVQTASAGTWFSMEYVGN